MRTIFKRISKQPFQPFENKNFILLTLLVIAVLFMVEPAYAGPGGYIAKGLFKTFWGKILLGALTIILLPFILYVKFREYFAVRKNKKILSTLGAINKDFRWSNLEKNIRNVHGRVYIAWSNENMEEVSKYVSSWYWQNQQLVFLDEWKSKNLQNICNLKNTGKIIPLHLEITDNENLEGSRIAFSISADVEDYLINRETREVVYGRKGYENEEKIWFMEYAEGNWILDEIREGSLSLAFAKLKNEIPENLPQVVSTKRTSNI